MPFTVSRTKGGKPFFFIEIGGCHTRVVQVGSHIAKLHATSGPNHKI